MMAVSAIAYFYSKEMIKGLQHLGFPNYFRIKLAAAKLTGAAILIIPGVQLTLKEWAFAGFGILFISAFIAHLSIGDSKGAMFPLIAIGLLAASYISYHSLV
jgi:hypothetical protein